MWEGEMLEKEIGTQWLQVIIPKELVATEILYHLARQRK